MAYPPLLRLDHIMLTFGGPPLLSDASLSISPGEHIALVGRNGSGKSTFLKIAAGLVEATSGDRFTQPGTTIRYLPQNPDLSAFTTLSTYLESGLGPLDDHSRLSYFLDQLHLNGDEQISNLSGGEARRAALAHILIQNPDILLLDEPTNHLDLTAILWLEKELKQMRSAFVLISHDRRFLETLTHTTVWLDRGVSRKLNDGFKAFEEWRDLLLQEEKQQQHQLNRQIAREEHWLRHGVTARRKRNIGRLAHLQSLRQKRDHQKQLPEQAIFTMSDSKESGKLILEAKNICKAYDSRILVQNFSIRIKQGDRLGLIGANGMGKTTLLSLLSRGLEPDSGTVRHGLGLEIAILDQKRTLNENETLSHYLTSGMGDMVTINGEQRHIISWLQDLLFLPSQAHTPIRALSGGERMRLMLARLFTQQAQLLILDEPTNDLDMETLDLLQELIAQFSGTVILVSHDRDFLDRTVTSIIAPQEQGQWLLYAGGYSDLAAQNYVQQSKPQQSKAVKKSFVTQSHSHNKHGDKSTALPQSKLSYKQQYSLERLPAMIEKAIKDITEFTEILSDPDFYQTNSEQFYLTTQKLSSKQKELNQMEEEWLELELLREELLNNK